MEPVARELSYKVKKKQDGTVYLVEIYGVQWSYSGDMNYQITEIPVNELLGRYKTEVKAMSDELKPGEESESFTFGFDDDDELEE